ncbi:MAG TPA: cellulose synthase operon protein YhjQ/BcsQ [Anaeromyxobacteraceae bacterium]|nr:cellulose synthase operon protein YhjQ/BcsQ [Anaeromyxobacteraceae bacterium]
MLRDVGQLLHAIRVPGFSYRELRPGRSPGSRRPHVAAPDRLVLVAVVSLVRAVGRTTIAANLAAALARHGCRTVAFDLDPSGELGLHFGLEPQPQAMPLDPALLAEPTWVADRLGHLPFGRDPALALEPLSARCEVVVLDTPPRPTAQVEQAVAEADEVVVVTRPDAGAREAVRASEALLARCRMHAWRRSRARYLVNRFDGRRREDRTALAGLRQALGDRLLAPTVQADAAVPAALAAGCCVIEVDPLCQAAADLESLAAQLVSPAAHADLLRDGGGR